jgi:peptidoglycan/LPS O-acetylase OafA/YrhL
VPRPDLPVLTTLRFPAAAAILLIHYLPLAGFPLAACEGLASGVSFFYVLSGFILYYNYDTLTDRAFFWTARFARIWPLHFVTLLLALLFLPFDLLLGHAHWPITLPANVLLIHAWLPFHGSALSYNGVSWSLSVEAFFYLCFPWLLVVLKKMGAVPLLAATFITGLLVAVAAVFVFPEEPAIPSFCPLCRVFEFALGMATCHFWLQAPPRQSTWRWVAVEMAASVLVVLLIFAVRPLVREFGIPNSISDWLATEFSAVVFAGLIWIFAHQAGLMSRALSGPICVRLGEISFAMYMVHQLVLRCLAGDNPILGVARSPLFFALYLALTLVLSYLLFAWIEGPARHLIINAYKSRRDSRIRRA